MHNLIHKIIRGLVAVAFLWSSVDSGRAAELALGAGAGTLPAPGQMVELSRSVQPPLLKGVRVYAAEPFRLDFILDKGDTKADAQDLKTETDHLIKYFLASLTVPENDLWVNLSPYEKDRIITNEFGLTEMGRDLLAQDYLLKQLTASVIFPDGETGKKFWAEIYKRAWGKFGTTDIPIDTFNKVWIVPEKAVVLERTADSGQPKAAVAYIADAKLKVMLEADYLAQKEGRKDPLTSSPSPSSRNETQGLAKEVLRDIVIPVLEREVNEGANFTHLRQVYYSLILAAWYKRKIKDSLLNAVYVDQKKVAGVNIDDPNMSEKIWAQYVEAFKKGAYNLIREERDEFSGEVIPKKYFSGGAIFKMDPAMQVVTDPAMTSAWIAKMKVTAKDLQRLTVYLTNKRELSERDLSKAEKKDVPDDLRKEVWRTVVDEHRAGRRADFRTTSWSSLKNYVTTGNVKEMAQQVFGGGHWQSERIVNDLLGLLGDKAPSLLTAGNVAKVIKQYTRLYEQGSHQYWPSALKVLLRGVTASNFENVLAKLTVFSSRSYSRPWDYYWIFEYYQEELTSENIEAFLDKAIEHVEDIPGGQAWASLPSLKGVLSLENMREVSRQLDDLKRNFFHREEFDELLSILDGLSEGQSKLLTAGNVVNVLGFLTDLSHGQGYRLWEFRFLKEAIGVVRASTDQEHIVATLEGLMAVRTIWRERNWSVDETITMLQALPQGFAAGELNVVLDRLRTLLSAYPEHRWWAPSYDFQGFQKMVPAEKYAAFLQKLIVLSKRDQIFGEEDGWSAELQLLKGARPEEVEPVADNLVELVKSWQDAEWKGKSLSEVLNSFRPGPASGKLAQALVDLNSLVRVWRQKGGQGDDLARVFEGLNGFDIEEAGGIIGNLKSLVEAKEEVSSDVLALQLALAWARAIRRPDLDAVRQEFADIKWDRYPEDERKAFISIFAEIKGTINEENGRRVLGLLMDAQRNGWARWGFFPEVLKKIKEAGINITAENIESVLDKMEALYKSSYDTPISGLPELISFIDGSGWSDETAIRSAILDKGTNSSVRQLAIKILGERFGHNSAFLKDLVFSAELDEGARLTALKTWYKLITQEEAIATARDLLARLGPQSSGWLLEYRMLVFLLGKPGVSLALHTALERILFAEAEKHGDNFEIFRSWYGDATAEKRIQAFKSYLSKAEKADRYSYISYERILRFLIDQQELVPSVFNELGSALSYPGFDNETRVLLLQAWHRLLVAKKSAGEVTDKTFNDEITRVTQGLLSPGALKEGLSDNLASLKFLRDTETAIAIPLLCEVLAREDAEVSRAVMDLVVEFLRSRPEELANLKIPVLLKVFRTVGMAEVVNLMLANDKVNALRSRPEVQTFLVQLISDLGIFNEAGETEIDGETMSPEKLLAYIFQNWKFRIPGYVDDFFFMQKTLAQMRNSFQQGYSQDPQQAERFSYKTVRSMDIDKYLANTSGHLIIHKPKDDLTLLEAIFKSGYILPANILGYVNEKNTFDELLRSGKISALGRTDFVHVSFNNQGSPLRSRFAFVAPVEVGLENHSFFTDPLKVNDWALGGFSRNVDDKTHQVPVDGVIFLAPESMKEVIEAMFAKLEEANKDWHRPNKIYYYQGSDSDEGYQELKQKALAGREKEDPTIKVSRMPFAFRELVGSDFKAGGASIGRAASLLAINKKALSANGKSKYRQLPYLQRFSRPMANPDRPEELLLSVRSVTGMLEKVAEQAVERSGLVLHKFPPNEPGQPVQDTGSGTRGTYKELFRGLPEDFDIMAYIDGEFPTREALAGFGKRFIEELRSSGLLRDALGSDVDFDVKMLEGTRYEPESGYALTTFQIKQGRESNYNILSIDVVFYNKERHNDGPRYKNKFRENMNLILSALSEERMVGPLTEKRAGEEYILSSIRTLKILFQNDGVYKRWEGGLRGVGTEQLVMQMRTTDQRGTPETVGSFEELKQIYSVKNILKMLLTAGFDKEGKYVSLAKALSKLKLADIGAEGDVSLAAGLNENSYNKLLRIAAEHKETDKAQAPGGIDLNRIDRTLSADINGEAIKFHIDPVLFEQYRSSPGFVPVIVNIQPMNDLPAFLSAQVEEPAFTGG